jgi:hypothetical protein
MALKKSQLYSSPRLHKRPMLLKLEQGERQIYGVAAEPIGAGTDDRRRTE